MGPEGKIMLPSFPLTGKRSYLLYSHINQALAMDCPLGLCNLGKSSSHPGKDISLDKGGSCELLAANTYSRWEVIPWPGKEDVCGALTMSAAAHLPHSDPLDSHIHFALPGPQLF